MQYCWYLQREHHLQVAFVDAIQEDQGSSEVHLDAVKL